MIAVDTNVLVYTHRTDSPWHEQAARRVRDLAQGTAPWAIPWPCIHEFLSIVTHPRIYKPPTPFEAALAQVAAWLESPTLVLISESAGYWEVLRRTAIPSQIAGPRIHDARIAALCLQQGVHELWTADRDFSRFPALKIRNPLVS